MLKPVVTASDQYSEATRGIETPQYGEHASGIECIWGGVISLGPSFGESSPALVSKPSIRLIRQGGVASHPPKRHFCFHLGNERRVQD